MTRASPLAATMSRFRTYEPGWLIVVGWWIANRPSSARASRAAGGRRAPASASPSAASAPAIRVDTPSVDIAACIGVHPDRTADVDQGAPPEDVRPVIVFRRAVAEEETAVRRHLHRVQLDDVAIRENAGAGERADRDAGRAGRRGLGRGDQVAGDAVAR